jgi:uncharacterized protein (DUF924 family)
MFVKMPFMHSETLADQVECMKLFGSEPGSGTFADKHHAIIEKWGRFRMF